VSLSRSAASLFLVIALSACGNTAADSPSADAPAADAPAADATTGPDSPVSKKAQTPPPGSAARLRPLGGSKPAVRWTPNGLEVRAFGSSTCPPVATGVVLGQRGVAVIELTPKGDGPCTDDWGPHNSWVAAPAGLDRRTPLTVRLRDDTGLSAPIRVDFLDNSAM
jgi:hypothetical protein